MTVRKSKAFLPLLFATTCLGADPTPGRVEVRQLQMGVLATLTVYADDPQAARAACARAFDKVRALNDLLSDYDPDSELRRLIARGGQGPIPISPTLCDALSDARQLAEWSGGRLDPTIGPLVQLWREARRKKALPPEHEIAKARALVGYQQVIVDATNRTVALALKGLKLDLGAFGKGLAGDWAIRNLREAGFPSAMFEAGGDMVFGDAPPGAEGWPVEVPGVALPAMRLANMALSVSGATMQFAEIHGIRYSHVVDPHTGYGLTNQLICVVRAPSGRWSDPLSTAGTLMAETAFRRMLKERFPDAQAWVFPARAP